MSSWIGVFLTTSVSVFTVKLDDEHQYGYADEYPEHGNIPKNLIVMTGTSFLIPQDKVFCFMENKK
jgi:hypothetical protein